MRQRTTEERRRHPGASGAAERATMDGARDRYEAERQPIQRPDIGLRPDTIAPRIKPAAVVIGCSTGGPAGLTTVLESLSIPLDIPILVVQHMPPRFTKRFADNLNKRVESTVVEAEHGMVATGGTCYIAPGGLHMEISRSGDGEIKLRITDSVPVSFCKPSVDKLFASAAAVLEHRTLAVMMTGMGRDGARGAQRLAEFGCPVIAQDKESSTVWGMPKAVVDSGAATDVLHLDEIGPRILSVATIGYRKRRSKEQRPTRG